MKKSRLLVLLLVLAVTIPIVSGVALGNLNQSSPPRGTVTLTVAGDKTVYTSSGAMIPFKWGTVNIGENTKTVTITNHANVNLKPHLALTSPNLPRGWTLTFSLENQQIPAGQSVKGTLTLHVPAKTLAGNYNWGAGITLDGAKK